MTRAARKVLLSAAAAVVSVAALMNVPGTSAAVSRCGNPTVRPWCDTRLSADQRAALLLKAMTLNEKIDLLAADDALGGPQGGYNENAHTDTSLGIPRLGVPTLYLADGPAGVRQGKATALPAPISLAAGFDTAAARRYGAAVAYETKYRGNDVNLGPSLDVLRHPYNGRSFEGYGEDPYLSSRLGVHWIQGMQGQGVMAQGKALAAYTQEENRMALDVRVAPRTLREIYLAPFEAAAKEGGVASFMCGIPLINGVRNCQNGGILSRIVRREWGFKGFIASDHVAVRDAAAAANGGLDLELPIGLYYNQFRLGTALRQGEVTEATINAHVTGLLRTMFRFGMFDRPAHPNDLNRRDRTGTERTARQVEEAGITLLKNAGGALPLKSPKSIAVIGYAADVYKGGFGSAAVSPTKVVTPRQGITRRAGPRARIVFNDGAQPARAAAAARRADVAIVFAADSMGEFFDKKCLTLKCGDPFKGDQDALVDAVAKANRNTIVVLETAGPVLTPWAGKVKGIVEAWYPGQEGGSAIARVLYGDADPGGRLPVTFPVRERDVPTAGNPRQYPGVNNVATFSEGVFIGYRHYDAKRFATRFPFGHGLSYTRFGYRGLLVRPDRVEVTVTNTGHRSGVVIPQLYVRLPAPSARIPQPPKQLKGFVKLTLAPGASKRVVLPLTQRDLSYWDEASGSWKVAPGCYKVMVGNSSRDLPLSGAFGRGGASCRAR